MKIEELYMIRKYYCILKIVGVHVYQPFVNNMELKYLFIKLEK